MEPYKAWLELKDDYNEDVLRTFISSLKSLPTYKKKKLVALKFEAYIRGKRFYFSHRSFNRLLGFKDHEFTEWKEFEDKSDWVLYDR